MKQMNKIIDNDHYIIDFERINELTSHENDGKQVSGTTIGPIFIKSPTRKIINRYMDMYLSGERSMEIINTLRYNKILLSKSDIRDDKINKIIN